MKVGITLAVAGLALGTVAGCGASATQHRAVSDSVVTAGSTTSAADTTSTPVAVSAGFGFRDAGPGWASSARHHPARKHVRPPIAPPSCPEGPTVHFDTPEAAMTYLAAAWNRDDLTALCQVTNPNARFELDQMHHEAVNLRLAKCARLGVGQYSCTFRHDYPARMHKTGTGRAWFDVGAADDPGWYMTGFEGCG
jgi:hypothetical protein